MSVVDFKIFRDLTGGNKSLEPKLFNTFLESGKACLSLMQESIALKDFKAWKEQAKALNGSSANLGAVYLSYLCFQAQDMIEPSIDDKRMQYHAIEAEFVAVQDCLLEEIRSLES